MFAKLNTKRMDNCLVPGNISATKRKPIGQELEQMMRRPWQQPCQR